MHVGVKLHVPHLWQRFLYSRQQQEQVLHLITIRLHAWSDISRGQHIIQHGQSDSTLKDALAHVLQQCCAYPYNEPVIIRNRKLQPPSPKAHHCHERSLAQL